MHCNSLSICARSFDSVFFLFCRLQDAKTWFSCAGLLQTTACGVTCHSPGGSLLASANGLLRNPPPTYVNSSGGTRVLLCFVVLCCGLPLLLVDSGFLLFAVLHAVPVMCFRFCHSLFLFACSIVGLSIPYFAWFVGCGYFP